MSVYVLPTPSKEQAQVLDCLAKNHVITCSAPGSGKTTLALNVVRHFKKAQAVIVTYNRVLCDDVRIKLKHLQFDSRVKCFTYHALIGFLCDCVCMDDEKFLELLDTRLISVDIRAKLDFNLLIIDEMQDMRIHHYRLVFQMLRNDYQLPRRLLFIGDPQQLLYNFYKNNPADSRFLTEAHQIFRPFCHGCAFQRCDLSVSFRLTPNIARFVNHLFPSPGMTGGNVHVPNRRVQVVVGNLFANYGHLIQFIRATLNERPMHETMFLSSSISSSKPLQNIIQRLTKTGVRFLVTDNRIRQEKSHEMQQHKVLVTTFCGAKGLERPRVFVFGLAYQMNRKAVERMNQLFVALTRSCGGELYLICHNTQRFDWLRGLHQDCYEIIELHEHRPRSLTPSSTTSSTSQTLAPLNKTTRTLLAYLDTVCIVKAKALIQSITLDLNDVNNKQEVLTDATDDDNFDDRADAMLMLGTESEEMDSHNNDGGLIRFGATVEDTNHLIEIALPLMMQYEIHGRCVQVEKALRQLEQAKDRKQLFETLTRLYFAKEENTVRRWLHMANILQSLQTGFSHLLAQVKSYDWFDHFNLEPVRHFFTTQARFRFQRPLLLVDDNVTLSGVCDAITENGEFIYTFVHVSTIESCTLLEAAIKLFVLQKTSTRVQASRIYNTKTNTIVEVTLKDGQSLYQMLVDYHRSKAEKIPLPNFLNNCRRPYETFFAMLEKK